MCVVLYKIFEDVLRLSFTDSVQVHVQSSGLRVRLKNIYILIVKFKDID